MECPLKYLTAYLKHKHKDQLQGLSLSHKDVAVFRNKIITFMAYSDNMLDTTQWNIFLFKRYGIF